MTTFIEGLPTLMQWYASSARPLPWRQCRTPYHTWISEIMLQQTQVTTVIPYFQRFLGRFPDIATLAGTSLQEVLQQFEGLGYYARARHLHQAAQQIMVQHEGEFPKHFKDILSLPGIGPSTAGAIVAVTSQGRHPVVDANIRRVFLRLTNNQNPPTTSMVQKSLFALADTLVQHAQDPDNHHQALMELGALICTPKNPQCPICPWKDLCKAYQHNTVTKIPLKTPPKTLPKRHTIAILLTQNDHILMRQRPETGFLGGLWELPQIPKKPRAQQTLEQTLCTSLKIHITPTGSPWTTTQTYSHFQAHITVYPYQSTTSIPQGLRENQNHLQWIPRQQLQKTPMDRATRRIVTRERRS